MSKDIITYPSVFNPDINIMVIFQDNKNYPELEKIFEQYGFGFYSPEHRMIIIDGEIFVDSELNMDDLRFVEAHEISHLLLGHDGPRSEKDELDADLGAYILLKRRRLSTERLEDTFLERHGIEFSEDLLGRVENLI
jgi:hypothetical protein